MDIESWPVHFAHNIFETINPTRISKKGKFMIISQAKLLVPSTFLAKVHIYGVMTQFVDFDPDRYITSSKLTRRKFMIISQAKLLVPSTFWLKFIYGVI